MANLSGLAMPFLPVYAGIILDLDDVGSSQQPYASCTLSVLLPVHRCTANGRGVCLCLWNDAARAFSDARRPSKPEDLLGPSLQLIDISFVTPCVNTAATKVLLEAVALAIHRGPTLCHLVV